MNALLYIIALIAGAITARIIADRRRERDRQRAQQIFDKARSDARREIDEVTNTVNAHTRRMLSPEEAGDLGYLDYLGFKKVGTHYHCSHCGALVPDPYQHKCR